MRPAWSPDGRQIAFTGDKDGNREIYVMNADGTGLVRLTDNTVEDGTPSWSPHGRQIAFARRVLGRPQIFVMNAKAGAEHQILLSPDFFYGGPNWGRVPPASPPR